MDPALCLEHEVRKAQINRESVVAIFFDIEKAYDIIWKEWLLIQLSKLGIKGPMYRWIKDFLLGRSIQVNIGKCYSGRVENGMGFSLFADDGTVWKRGRNLKFIVKKLQWEAQGKPGERKQ